MPQSAPRRGLFGGFNPLRFDPRVSGQDRSMALFATLADLGQGGSSNISNVMESRQKRMQEEARAQAMGNLNRGLFGGGQPTQTLDLQDLAQGGQGRVIDQPAAPGRQGLPSLREAGPALIAAQQAGIPIDDYISLLDKTGPDMQVVNGQAYDRRGVAPGQRIGVNLSNVNGTMIDQQDPTNANRFVPNVGENQELLYDANNRPVVRNIQGSVEAGAYREAANVGARESATAPYRFVNVQGPDGAPTTMSVANAAGQSFTGQAPGARVYDEASARNQAAREETAQTRASAAARMLPTLDKMEELLPDVIAGYGADARLGMNRLGGALGLQGAADRAGATEIFKNEARQIVAQIIGTFGANPTEGERKYAEQMAGADVNITPQALEEGIRLTRERAARDMAGAPNRGTGRGAPPPPPGFVLD